MYTRKWTSHLNAVGIALLTWALWFPGCSRKEPPANEQTSSVQPAESIGSSSTSIELANDTTNPASSDATTTVQPPLSASDGEIIAPQSDPGDGVPPFQPLADAQAGEWVRLAAMDSRELRYEVVGAEAASVTTRVTVLQDGKPLGLPAEREDMRNWDPLASSAKGNQAERSVSEVTIEAAGRSWNGLLYEDRWTDEGVSYIRRTWVHPDAPVFGTIRMELYGDDTLEARLELIAFGGTSEAANENAPR